ncbi:hypothetical protein H0H93_003965 [Arthromyces matolae]|nr:hypothetical protein H0H93_003965 [Arthromyces matolae]
MTIAFNAENARAAVCRMPNYVASESFATSVQWKKRGIASVLLERNRQSNEVTDAVCVIIGEVSDSKLFTDPLGNYNPEYNKLATAKYQLSLISPSEPVLADDFKVAMKNLACVQDEVAVGTDNRYFLIRTEGSDDHDAIRLSAVIAEPRTRHLDTSETLDEESASIVVDGNKKEVVDKFKLTHKMLPLKVYGTDDAPIPPEEVTKSIRGAVVEMYFRLKHYYMGNGDTKFNCFAGAIEQIIVLRKSDAAAGSPFRNSARKGPFRPQIMDIAPMAALVPTRESPVEKVNYPLPGGNVAKLRSLTGGQDVFKDTALALAADAKVVLQGNEVTLSNYAMKEKAVIVTDLLKEAPLCGIEAKSPVSVVEDRKDSKDSTLLVEIEASSAGAPPEEIKRPKERVGLPTVSSGVEDTPAANGESVLREENVPVRGCLLDMAGADYVQKKAMDHAAERNGITSSQATTNEPMIANAVPQTLTPAAEIVCSGENITVSGFLLGMRGADFRTKSAGTQTLEVGGRQLRSAKHKAGEDAGGDEKRRKEA